MASVQGIGGVFLHAADAEALAGWYAKHFGIVFSSEGTPGTFYVVFPHRDFENPKRRRNVTFAIMYSKKDPGSSRRQYTINYVVDDLKALARKLRRAGIALDTVRKLRDDEGYGLFTNLRDPEGNRIDLYQPLR